MGPGVQEAAAHAGSLRFWQSRLSADRKQYTAQHDLPRQQLAIESLLLSHLHVDDYFSNGLDFGCGHGRFIPLLSKFCAHLWAADIVPEALEAARMQAFNVSTLPIGWPLTLPFQNCKIDFLWAGLVFQHITDSLLLQRTLTALSNSLKSGARVLILDNAVDNAGHVKSREPGVFANALRLGSTWRASKVTINDRAEDHWLIEGRVD